MVDGYSLGIAQANGRAADSWMAYARELEQKLATEKASNLAARTLAKALSEELMRVAPTSPLAKKENRTKIFNEAYNQA